MGDEGVAEGCLAVSFGRQLRGVGDESPDAVCGETGEGLLQFSNGFAVVGDQRLGSVFVQEVFERSAGVLQLLFEQFVRVVLSPA